MLEVVETRMVRLSHCPLMEILWPLEPLEAVMHQLTLVNIACLNTIHPLGFKLEERVVVTLGIWLVNQLPYHRMVDAWRLEYRRQILTVP